jgi:hypothetical protein
MYSAGRSLSVCLILLLGVMTTSCADKAAEGDGGVDGVGEFKFGVSNGWASLSVVLEDFNIDVGGVIPLGRPQGAFVEISPNFLGAGTLFKIAVPLASLLQGNGDLPQVGLPDGRPLPGVKNGVLGVVAVDLPALGRVFLYLGQDVFGIFFPISLPKSPVMVKVGIRDEKGNLLGTLFGIPKGSGSVSGALFLFPVEGTSSARYLNGVL